MVAWLKRALIGNIEYLKRADIRNISNGHRIFESCINRVLDDPTINPEMFIMANRDSPFSRKNIFVSILCLGSAAAVPVVLTWAIVDLFYTLFLVNIALTIVIWAIYGLLWILSLNLAYRVIAGMRKGKFGTVPVRKKYVAISLMFLVGAISPIVVFGMPSWIPEDMYPHLSFTGNPATSMTLTWYSASPYVGQVTYGTSPTNLNFTLTDPGSTNSHVFNFTNLTPNTRYYYSIKQFGNTWSFKTASNQQNHLKFLAFSDVHSMFYPPMVPAMQAANPDFMIADGDLADYGYSNENWQAFFNLLSPLATNYSLMTSIGNHDTMVVGEQNYLKYLTMPTNSSGTGRYYHFKYNSVDFFCLECDWGLDSFDNTQWNWFQNEMAHVPSSDWIIVYEHCVQISSGSYNNGTGSQPLLKSSYTAGNIMDFFHDYFVSHHVNLVISGHDHHFEISNWGGVVYAIVGTANTRLDDRSATVNKDSINYVTGHSGFTEVQINGGVCTLIGHLYYDNNNTAMAPVVYSFIK